MNDKPITPLDKFKEVVRELECADNEARFDDRMSKLVDKKSVEDRPE
jgi:hypothetical protein